MYNPSMILVLIKSAQYAVNRERPPGTALMLVTLEVERVRGPSAVSSAIN